MAHRVFVTGTLLVAWTLCLAFGVSAQPQIELQGSWCNPPNNLIPYNVNDECPGLAFLVDAAAAAWDTVFAINERPYRLRRPAVLESEKSCEYTDTPDCAVNGNYRKCEFAGMHRNSVDWCLTVDDTGRVTVRGYLGDPAEVPYGSIDQDVLAFTVTDIDPNPNADGQRCCIKAADICILFGYKNCTPIDWHMMLTPPGAQTYDMFSVILHELGHYLGLGHSNDPNDVMFPTITGGERKNISALTVQAIGELYGANRFNWPSTTVESSSWGRLKALFQ